MTDVDLNCKGCTRREFLRRSAVGGGTVILGSLWLEACSDPTAPPPTGGGRREKVTIILDNSLSQYSALAQIGGTLALDEGALPGLPAQGLLVVREAETVVRAFSRRCTHRSCTVNPFSGGVAKCGCHGSQFDTKGKVVKGPAAESLFEYNATIEDGNISISV